MSVPRTTPECPGIDAVDPQDKKPRPERDLTDESLRAERSTLDEATARRLVDTEHHADALIGRARENADAVLTAARDQADIRDGAESHGLARARALEDLRVNEQRSTADEILRREREDHARVLAELLPMERETTDRHLLTERNRSDEELAHRDDFLGIVSHDLRNLLSGIVLNTHVLTATTREREDGERVGAGMQRIQRYAARMNRLIGDLVDIVSIDAGRLAIERAPCDATAVLLELIETFAPMATQKGIALEADIAEGPLHASFDHDRVLQVLANLVSNALKFTPRGGRVSVQGERRDTCLHLWVRDSGCGIPDTLLGRVFDRFWQVGVNDRRGLGLGLYISKCIVEGHGGRISIASELGRGSVVHVELPASS